MPLRAARREVRQRRRILQHMNAWGAFANVKFAETRGTAQVRIAREGGEQGGDEQRVIAARRRPGHAGPHTRPAGARQRPAGGRQQMIFVTSGCGAYNAGQMQ